MPTYEYECRKCEHRFERFQSMNDPPVSVCPECQGEVRRLISGGSGLHFRGSGFYITENRSKGYQEGKKKEEGGGAAGGGALPGGEKPKKEGGPSS